MSVLDQIKEPPSRGPEAEFAFDDEEFSQRWPGIFEILARQYYQGKERAVGRLILYSEPEKATLVLCDRETGQVAFYAASTFVAALEGLEKALQNGGADWRKDKRSWKRG